jgi:hypothetical protein
MTKVVKNGNGMSAGQQNSRDGAANVTSPARNQDFHAFSTHGFAHYNQSIGISMQKSDFTTARFGRRSFGRAGPAVKKDPKATLRFWHLTSFRVLASHQWYSRVNSSLAHHRDDIGNDIGNRATRL